jgi:hypothetical protein
MSPDNKIISKIFFIVEKIGKKCSSRTKIKNEIPESSGCKESK